jgi:hypothetical protein
MDSDSRKAHRNSFAHHRADLLFKQPNMSGNETWDARLENTTVDETIVSPAWWMAARQPSSARVGVS